MNRKLLPISSQLRDVENESIRLRNQNDLQLKYLRDQIIRFRNDFRCQENGEQPAQEPRGLAVQDELNRRQQQEMNQRQSSSASDQGLLNSQRSRGSRRSQQLIGEDDEQQPLLQDEELYVPDEEENKFQGEALLRDNELDQQDAIYEFYKRQHLQRLGQQEDIEPEYIRQQPHIPMIQPQVPQVQIQQVSPRQEQPIHHREERPVPQMRQQPVVEERKQSEEHIEEEVKVEEEPEPIDIEQKLIELSRAPLRYLSREVGCEITFSATGELQLPLTIQTLIKNAKASGVRERVQFDKIRALMNAMMNLITKAIASLQEPPSDKGIALHKNLIASFIPALKQVIDKTQGAANNVFPLFVTVEEERHKKTMELLVAAFPQLATAKSTAEAAKQIELKNIAAVEQDAKEARARFNAQMSAGERDEVIIEMSRAPLESINRLLQGTGVQLEKAGDQLKFSDQYKETIRGMAVPALRRSEAAEQKRKTMQRLTRLQIDALELVSRFHRALSHYDQHSDVEFRWGMASLEMLKEAITKMDTLHRLDQVEELQELSAEIQNMFPKLFRDYAALEVPFSAQ